MSAVKIIQAYAKKSLTKNQGSGITTLPSQFMAESKAGEIAAILQQAGMPLQQLDNFIRSEADLVKFLNIIKNAKPVSTTEKASGTILPFKQKRSFAEEIEAMKKSGDIVDVDDIKISEKITDREMFKNSNLNKPTIEGQMDKINAASNRIKQIQKEQADMYRPKSDAEISAKYDKENKESIQRFKDKMKKDEPEDKADGGRIGFRAGKFVFDKVVAKFLKNQKKLQEAVDDIFPTGDYKYDAEMAADAFVENNPQIFKNLLREDLPDEVSSEIYGAVLRPITNNMAKMRELRKATRPEKTLQSMKENKTIDMSDPEIADEFGRFMKETDPEGYKKLEQTVELSNFDPKGRKKNATGGRAGFYTGGITDVEPSLDDIGHGSDSLMSRTRLMSPGSQTTTSTGLNYLLAEDNDNLRVPFAGGGDAGRRAFLKLMASIGGLTAAAKSGILGLGEGTGKKAVTETIKQSAGSGRPPPYFFKLVEKIKFMGDDAVASQDKAIAKKYKDYILEEDFAGNISIIRKGDMDAPGYEEVYMGYSVDDVPLKGKKGSTKVEEYDEYTVRPDEDGKMKDVEDGVPEDVLDDAGDPDSMTLKKADGGRIGLFLGGPLLKNQLTSGKGLLREMLNYMSKGSSSGKTGSEMLQMVNPKQFEKLLNDPSMYNKISPEAGITAPELIRNMIKKTKDDRAGMVEELLSSARNIKKVDDDMIGYKNKIIEEMINKGIDREMAETFADMMSKKIMKEVGPKRATPEITEKGLLELENIQKNLINKDRKLQAQGGLTTMLGE